jgi:chemotaxis protein MotB
MKKLLGLFFLMFIVSGCVTMQKYNTVVDEANDYEDKLINLTTQYDDLNKQKTDLENKIATLEQDNKNLSNSLTSTQSEKNKMISDLTTNKHELESKIKDLESQIAGLQKEKDEAIASMKKSYDNLVENMKSEINEGAIQITQLKNKLTVNMVDKVLFNSGEAEVTKKGRSTLDKVGAVLKKITDKQIRIEGHTDNVPIKKEFQYKYPSNWELSTSRATNVARYLIDNAGINSKLVSFSGYADTRPVDTNDTPEGRTKNRRIEIVLVPLE